MVKINASAGITRYSFHIYDQHRNRLFEIDYSGKGIDGIWYTADDEVSNLEAWQYDAQDYRVREIDYNGPGADGVAPSPDDEVIDYTNFLYNDNGDVYRSIEYNGPGLDNVWFNGDDQIAARREYAYNYENYTVRYVKYIAPGPDGDWFTSDDAIEHYQVATFDSNFKPTEYKDYYGSGPDGIWFTGDDVLQDEDIFTYDVLGRLKRYTHNDFLEQKQQVDDYYYNTDGLCTRGIITINGSILGYANFLYDQEGHRIEDRGYFSPGIDGQWFTTDDVYGGGNFYEYDPDPVEIRYTITDLGTLGGNTSRAVDINESNQVLCNSSTGTNDPKGNPLTHPFLWYNGQITDLGAPGNFSCSGTALNNVGQIVGYYDFDGTYNFRAFLHNGQGFLTIDPLGGADNTAQAINDWGQVVGRSDIDNPQSPIFDPQGAFWFSAGTLADLGQLGDQGYTYATDINNRGFVTGSSELKGFVWSQSEGIQSLNVDGVYSHAYAINDALQVVGMSQTTEGVEFAFIWDPRNGMQPLPHIDGVSRAHIAPADINNRGQIVGSTGPYHLGESVAVLYQDGTMRRLNRLIAPGTGWNLLTANAINEAGYIVGTGTIGGQERGYLLTPLMPNSIGTKGDVDRTSVLDLADLIQALKATHSSTATVNLSADVDEDTRIGTAEAIFALQSLAGLRVPATMDSDGDGYSRFTGDCNDGSNAIHPWAPEICGDGIDQDCSGTDLDCGD